MKDWQRRCVNALSKMVLFVCLIVEDPVNVTHPSTKMSPIGVAF